MRRLLAVAFGLALVSGCLPFKDDGLYACDTDTGKDCVTCDAATGWCRDITAITAGSAGLSAISGAATDAIWATGSNGVIVRWNGTRWVPEASGTTNAFNAIWAATPSNVYAVGRGGVWSHFDGSRWTTGTETRSWYWPPNQTDTTMQVADFTAVGGSASWFTWALDSQGMVNYFSSDGWSFYGATATPTILWGAWGDDAGSSYFVGEGGTAIKDPAGNVSWFPGANADQLGVEVLSTGTPNELTAIWGVPSTNRFWAVGAAGTVIRFDGAAFSSQDAGVTTKLWGICGTSENDIWLVGENGTVVHRDMGVWQLPETLPFSEALYNIYCNAADIFVVTGEGAILHKKR